MSKAKEKKEVTTNQGKKHLFGSSEKSDFILNMSAESAQKLCGVYSIIAVLVLCVITIPYYFTQNIKYGMDESVNRTLYLNENLYSLYLPLCLRSALWDLSFSLLPT